MVADLGDGDYVGGVGRQVVFALAADLLQRGHAGDGEVGVAQGLQHQREDTAEHDGMVSQPLRQGACSEGGGHTTSRRTTDITVCTSHEQRKEGGRREKREPREESRTYGEHDGIGQLDVVDADARNEADEAGNDVGVVDVYRLGDGLESVQQRFRVLMGTGGP